MYRINTLVQVCCNGRIKAVNDNGTRMEETKSDDSRQAQTTLMASFRHSVLIQPFPNHPRYLPPSHGTWQRQVASTSEAFKTSALKACCKK